MISVGANEIQAKTLPIQDGLIAEFDAVSEAEWCGILDRFCDANIYQTWSYDSIRCGEQNISHFVLRSDHAIIAAAQARLVRIPVLGFGAAYVRWGPIWRLRHQEPEPAVFRAAVRALKNEYVSRRGLILRLFPMLYDTPNEVYHGILEDEGFKSVTEKSPSRTLIINLQGSLGELRQRLDQKWRNCLNRAEKNGLDVVEGTDDALFGKFCELYGELIDRKRFQAPNDINDFRTVQRALPASLKMRIFLCCARERISAGAVIAAVGDTGIYLFGATSRQGMADKSSYLLQWAAIRWMKEHGCRNYNLNGINRAANPGSYHFKAGLSGRSGVDVAYLGSFECYPGALTALLAGVLGCGFPIVRKTVEHLRIRGRSGRLPAGEANHA